MKLITILVDSQEEVDTITEVLTEAEYNGEIEFCFNMVSNDWNPDQAELPW
jgi:hypothetical protein